MVQLIVELTEGSLVTRGRCVGGELIGIHLEDYILNTTGRKYTEEREKLNIHLNAMLGYIVFVVQKKKGGCIYTSKPSLKYDDHLKK